ncbi:hypothetical protein [uncultured Parabacteroides sp.]|uniref:hypothetical protein n=1 Tax=uncultured Parabacteroides sp. TaxID=512312 RepID=UPI002635B96F|nr:hypothetical protein [uncultured Parabacteroides sp.]
MEVILLIIIICFVVYCCIKGIIKIEKNETRHQVYDDIEEKPSVATDYKEVEETIDDPVPVFPEIEELSQKAVNEIRDPFMIEEDTGYSMYLNSVYKLEVSDIQKFAREEAKTLPPPPGRGKIPLKDEIEMFQYVKSYANMHYAKIQYAIENLMWCENPGSIRIVDWGCGVGLATISFLEVTQLDNCSFYTLIEPSEVSLKRAALHTKLFHEQQSNRKFECRTICKEFDELSDIDVIQSLEFGNITVHLFSNVLDVESYDMMRLAYLIKRTQIGKNVFICVSPYQTVQLCNRIDDFVMSFSDCSDFQIICSDESKKEDQVWSCNSLFKGYQCYNDCEQCNSKWTKIVRVFSVNL